MHLFDQEWIEAAGVALAGLPTVDGADAVIDYVVAGTPDGKMTISVVVEGGVATDVSVGKSEDPDLVISLKYADAVAILSGEMGSEAGYMTGALKVEGAYPRWILDLRPTRLAAADALARLMSRTET